LDASCNAQKYRRQRKDQSKNGYSIRQTETGRSLAANAVPLSGVDFRIERRLVVRADNWMVAMTDMRHSPRRLSKLLMLISQAIQMLSASFIAVGQAIAPRHDAEAVMIDFVQPAGAARQGLSR
jgi:hypothetical protein